jgi:5,10-methylenetetrahydromethanopterin reductase
MSIEIWLHGFPIPHRTVELAMQAERWGFDGLLLLADSENLVGDPYVELTLAAQATERLLLGPAVTNPLTRHPAVTAAAIATLQVESEGRAVLVFGRGDSAVLQLGLRPATTAELERGLTELQGFLRGEDVELAGGMQARMAWIATLHPAKVPVAVAATGPRTISLGVRYGEHVNFTVGPIPAGSPGQ